MLFGRRRQPLKHFTMRNGALLHQSSLSFPSTQTQLLSCHSRVAVLPGSATSSYYVADPSTRSTAPSIRDVILQQQLAMSIRHPETYSILLTTKADIC